LKNECQDIVEGLAPSKTEETTNNSLIAMDGGELTTLRTFACTDQKKDLHCLHPVVCHDVERKMMAVDLD
jgi:hypothetical protein